MNKTIVLATDHAGFELKEHVKRFLKEKGYDIKDFGALEYNGLDDYPDFILPAAKFVSKHKLIGIIFGGSGQGEAMAANRIKGIRAAVFYNGPNEIVELSRLHNNANILSIGARFVNNQEVEKVIELWLSTDFEEGRHEKRINKLDS
uniref:Ribose 5-phosphate isomerase rpib n=1 Tax=uncultured Fidelibacterota bacterium HF0010_18O13 TaxID=710789 RepID=E0XRB2_9BACT|nr:ribose 5-phosphate isomerase rpib [uncultured Marinimicrobia bacterium HF0010_18O13]